MMSVISFFLHLDRSLAPLIEHHGTWVYAILFLVIFCETGLVFAPFLPGDSLLFAAGTFAALGSLHIGWLLLILFAAAILGDTTNYLLGRYVGESILRHPRLTRWIHPQHIERTKAFYDAHGSRMVLFARFVPVVRTIAPFIAGIGRMHYPTFLTYNIIGGLVWVFLFTMGGYLFGNIPFVKKHFSLVILFILLISLIPILREYRKRKRTP